MHIFYIYFLNFVFFIVLSRIEINEKHVNPYLLEPVVFLKIMIIKNMMYVLHKLCC